MVVRMFNQIPEHIIKQVQNAHNIVDVIGEHVQLTKRGNNYFGLCPFHDENTPSFSVSEDKQMYYCFGCKEGGNVISFLMKQAGLTFFESIQELASRANINLPNIGQAKDHLSTESRKLYEANEWLMKLYHHLLRFTKEGKEALNYLESRGITKESIDAFQIGYSPNIKNFTAQFLIKKGIHEQTLIKSGLFTKTTEDNMYDRFTGRVVFPIRDATGRTVGFSARSILDSTGGPKYINSSESEIFQKQQLLYNFDLARGEIRKKKEVILFEGQLDVITAYQNGLENVVATLGTSLSESHGKFLRRYANRAIISYDGDYAGQQASYRAAKILLKNGFDVRITHLDAKYDPDQYIKTYGIDAFIHQVLKVSESYMKFYMRFARKDFNLSNENEKVQYIKIVLQEIANIESSIEQEMYLKELSDQFSISIESLKEELRTFQRTISRQKNNESNNRYTKTTSTFSSQDKLRPAFHNAERNLISLMLKDESIASYVKDEIGADFNIDDHKVIVTALYAFYEEGNHPDVSLFIERLSDDHLRNLTAEIAMLPTFEHIGDGGLKDYIDVIKKQYYDVAILNEYIEKQRLAEQQNDPIKAAKIAMKILELQKKLKQSK